MTSNSLVESNNFFMTALSLCNVDGRCDGDILDDIVTESAQACLDKCKDYEALDGNSDTFCNWFTFDSATGACQLWNDCYDTDDGCESCLSGNVGCNRVEANSGQLKELKFT